MLARQATTPDKNTEGKIDMKRRSLLCAIGAIYVLNGLVMWFAANWWFDTVPGIRMMGPFNHHFVRDIGLVYLCSGLGLLTVLRSTAVAVFAGLWPAMHAVFHISMWFSAVSLSIL